MQRLVYASSATGEVSGDYLHDILRTARHNNCRDGISGMLLLVDQNFFQILEGPDDKVAACFQRIRHDPRHHGIHVFIEETADAPIFPNWSMGFRHYEVDNPRRSDPWPGAFNLSADTLQARAAELDAKASAVLHFMRTFYKVNSREDFL